MKDNILSFESILKIDIHAHIFFESQKFINWARESDLRFMNICAFGLHLGRMEFMEALAERLWKKYPELLAFCSTFDLTRREDRHYHDHVKDWLSQSYKAGACMTKIWKEVGMEIKDKTGQYLLPDNPLFDPIYRHIQEYGKILIAHLAEPIDSWRPLNKDSLMHGYLTRYPEWHVHNRPNFPRYEQIIAARDHILSKHPKLIMIGAHLGSMEHDLTEIAKRFDQYPNFYVDTAARTGWLTLQPSNKVRQFFVKYQDRILFGTDYNSGIPEDTEKIEEKVFSDIEIVEEIKKTDSRYRRDFQYYTGQGTMLYGNKQIECLNLPQKTLDRFFYKNALNIVPGLYPDLKI